MIGQTLAHYEILALLGRGGMGEVFRARDTKLGREVALKILPREMSGDPERIARFHREARTLASLQHPNVASIYGFEDLPEARFLVMELVEGEDLAVRLLRGPLSVSDTIEIGAQIARGLEAAHEQGIVHRDLKPANVKIAPDGTVKILDFGLARAYAGDQGEESDLANSPTITAALTQAGTILGTAAYMSPEQARGKFVDRRSDLWALGVILYEMLTGDRVFQGETVSDTLAAVLRKETDLDALPADTPAALRRVVRRCLARDPRKRLRAAGDVVLELEEREEEAVVVEAARGRGPWVPIAVLLVAVAIAAAGWLTRPAAHVLTEPRPTHLSITLPAGMQFVSRDRLPLGAPQPGLDISSDGRLVVCVVEDEHDTYLYRRFLDEAEGEIVPGSEGAYHPKISPDGTKISFLSGTFLKRVDARGDRVNPMIEVPNAFGQCWNGNGEILVTRREANELLRVEVQRNAVTPIPRLDGRDRYNWPFALPDGAHVLANESSVAKSEDTEADPIVLYALDGSSKEAVGIQGSQPQLRDDHLLFLRDGALMAAPFDRADPGREVSPFLLLEGLLVEANVGQYAFAEEGTLVYVPGAWLTGKSLVFDDGQGNVTELPFPSQGYGDFELSPDGRRLAITVGSSNPTVWIYDLERGTRRVLSTEGSAYGPTWSPDGSRVAYTWRSEDAYAIHVRTVGDAGAPLVVATGSASLSPSAWHEDVGLLCARWDQRNDIFRFDPDAGGGEDAWEWLVSSPASEWGPDISPDGKWMAYTSDESGRYEIYARSLVGNPRSWPLSVNGGEEPIFSADGSAVFFRDGNRFYRTPILEASADGTRFRAGNPEVVVEGAYANVPGLSFDVGPDDQQLLLLRTDGGTERANRLDVVLNWDVVWREKRAAQGR